MHWFPLTLGLLLAGMAGRAGAVEVTVSVAPQAYFVDRIGGEKVQVHVMVPAGQDPHTYEASPRQIVAAVRSRIYFTVGMPFESPLIRKLQASAPGMQVIDSAAGVQRRAIEEAHHDEGGNNQGADDREGKHEQEYAGEADPHIWLGPAAIAVQSRNIAAALTKVDPANRAAYEKNLAAFLEEIASLEKEIARRLAPFRGQAIYVYHPAFGYFTDAFGLRQEAVEVDGKSPTPRQLRELIAKARKAGIRVVFVQPQFSTRSAQVVADAIEGSVVPINNLEYDVLANLRTMADEIEKSLSPKPKGP